MFTSSVAFKTMSTMYNYCLIEKPMTGTVDVFVYEPPRFDLPSYDKLTLLHICVGEYILSWGNTNIFRRDIGCTLFLYSLAKCIHVHTVCLIKTSMQIPQHYTHALITLNYKTW